MNQECASGSVSNMQNTGHSKYDNEITDESEILMESWHRHLWIQKLIGSHMTSPMAAIVVQNRQPRPLPKSLSVYWPINLPKN